jgi:hypothetical protein
MASTTTKILLVATAVVAGAVASLTRDVDTLYPKRGSNSKTAVPNAESPSPAPDGARFPHLTRHTDGRIAMTWAERGRDSVPLVRFAIRQNGTWSAPSTIIRDSNLFVSYADVPQVAFNGKDLVATWLQRGTGLHAHGLRVAHSRDAGKTWTRNAPPHDSTVGGEHGFVSMIPQANGRTRVIFLDGQPHDAPNAATRLALVEYLPNGAIATQTAIDTRACDCCQTSAAVTAEGLAVVYRDRSNEEIRDIAITRESTGAWSTPTVVAHDNWKITGCPVNGPAIDANGKQVVVAWFTGARDTAKVQVAFSADAGKTFSAPLRVDGGSPAGQVDVVLMADGSAVVSWIERTNSEKLAVNLRRISGRTMSSPTTLGLVDGIRATGWPSIVQDGNGLLAAWTVPGSPSRIELRHIDPATLR